MRKNPIESYSIEKAIEYLKSDRNGISEAEANRRIEKFGYNEITERKKSNLLGFLGKFYGPIPIILWFIIILSYALNDLKDTYIVLALLIFNAVVSFAEEYKADKSMALLKSKLTTNSRVCRSGIWTQIPSRMVVPGDVIRIRAGDIISADSKIILGTGIEVDQSVVTGESLPVTRKLGDIIYGGATVKKGEATCLVFATGYDSVYGKTAKLVQDANPKFHLEDEILGVVKYLMLIDIAVVLILFTYGYETIHMPLPVLVIFLLVVFVASVPVALPAAFTVALALGAEKLAKKSILVTKLSAVEETATMNMLCMDKTGTITENDIKVCDIRSFGCDKDDVIKYASEASRKEDNDQIDNAVLDYGTSLSIKSGLQEAFTPFDPSIKRTEATIKDGAIRYKVAKGAPKIIADLCGLDKRDSNRFYSIISEFSKKGYRTIAVATKKGRWKLIGVIALSDRPRKDSRGLIKELRKLGIAIKMITGDNVAVATEISNEVGLGNKIVELDNYDINTEDSRFNEIKLANGFAGVYPNDKYAIVKLLQSHGYKVGMTGDGVNDSPALKQAEVGIAVKNATDIAKNAATLVLTENGIGVIVEAVKESRRIFERMLTYTIVKIAKVIQIIFFIAIIFVAYGFVPITAFLLILLIFMNDIANISLSTDNVGYSQTPDEWSIKKMFVSASVLGVPLVIEALLLVPICFGVFHATVPEFETATFILFNISGKFTIFNSRERGWFFRSIPSRPLIVSSVASIAAGIIMAYYGILMSAISPQLIAIIIVVSILFFLLSDLIKVKVNSSTGIMNYST